MRQIVVIIMFWTPVFAAFIDPFYGVVHYTLSSIIRPEQLMWGDMNAAGRIFLVIQAATFFSWVLNKNKLSPEDTPLPFQMKLLWVLSLEMIIVTKIFATNPAWSWRWTDGFIKGTILCFVMIKAFNNAKKVERLYALSLIWSCLLAIWGIQQKLGGNERMEGLGGVQLPDVNCLASVYVMYFPMAYFSLYSRQKWIKSFIGIPAFIIFVIFIMFGGSRGAFLGMMVCFFFLFLLSKGAQRFKIVFTLLFVGSLLFLVLKFLAPEGFFDEYKARLATIIGTEDESTGEVKHESSAAGRTAMWKGALYIYRNHPEYWLFGVGMNCYAQTYMNHIDELADYLNEEELTLVLFGGGGGKEIHNTCLNVLLGGGAVVFLTWILLIFVSWWQVHTIPKKYPQIINGVNIHNYARAIEIGIIGYCVCISFVNLEFNDFFYWYLTMAGVLVNLGKAQIKRQELGKEEEEWPEPSLARPARGYGY